MSNGSGDKAKGKGTRYLRPSDLELLDQVRQLRGEMESLKRKVDQQSEQLADQGTKTDNIAKSMAKLAQDSTVTAEAVASSSATVKEFLDVLHAKTSPTTQKSPLPPPPPPPVRPASAQASSTSTQEEEDMVDPEAPQECLNDFYAELRPYKKGEGPS